MNKGPRAALVCAASLSLAAALLPSQAQASSPPTADTEQAITTTAATTAPVATDAVTTTVAETVPSTSATVAPATSVPNAVDGEKDPQSDPATAAAATSAAPTTVPELLAAADAIGSIGGIIFDDRNNNGVFDLDQYEDGSYPSGVAVDVVCGDVTVNAKTGDDGKYLAENLPLGDCTVTVDRASFGVEEAYTTPTVDPDGALDGTAKVVLTSAAPAQLDQNFGFRQPPLVIMTMGTNGVKDTVADNQISVGDTIQFELRVRFTANVVDIKVTDSKLGLADAPCGNVIANPDLGDCLITTMYVITAEDVAAGGVETSATVRAVDPDTGEVVTDRSDTYTDLEGNEILDPGKVETNNPLKLNPNDTADPTDDPTTYLLSKTTTPAVNPPTSVPRRPGTTPVTGSSSLLFGLVALILVAAGFGLRRFASRSTGHAA